MEAPGALEVTRFPCVIVPGVIVPVCVVKGVSAPPCVSGVVTSVPECVLPSTPCVKGAPRVEEAACARETARVCEQPCVSERPSGRETACVRSLYVREMTVGMCEHAAASPGVSLNVMECSLGVVTRRCAWAERRRRLRHLRDKGRVAAVVALGTVPGLHSSERVVRAVQARDPHVLGCGSEARSGNASG